MDWASSVIDCPQATAARTAAVQMTPANIKNFIMMEPHGLKPVVPGLPRLVRYGEILSDNFATLVGVIRRHVTSAESAVAPRLFAAFIHGLKSRGILRRLIKFLRFISICVTFSIKY